ncbi:MAG: hypothetical protein J5800_01250 [Spirochaetales bacterium]|nr:hypothetical protein [Spirochaetales bacterium]
MIIDKLKAILHKVTPDFDVSKLTEQTDLRTDLGMDSLAMMLVSLEIEDAFSFRFEEPVDFKTVGDVVVYLREVRGIKD